MADKTQAASDPSAGKAPKANESSLFFATVSKTTLAINNAAAGAGVLGLVGFAGLFAVATIFFVTENFFLAMMMVSFALLVYVTGAELGKLFVSAFTIFFSSKHVLPRAAYLQETLVPLCRVLEMRRDPSGNVTHGPIEPNATIRLPNNPLVRDIKALLQNRQGQNTAEYIAHAYYVECHELYDYSSSHLEFVAGAMPLFGLIGTIVGLIGMFDSLGAEVTVEFLSPQLALALKTTLYGAVFSSLYKIIAARFDQRMNALDYDFETFCRAVQVLIENNVTVEVRA
jgi:chemotaxis protein MotA